jgi:hypothetical protein
VNEEEAKWVLVELLMVGWQQWWAAASVTAQLTIEEDDDGVREVRNPVELLGEEGNGWVAHWWWLVCWEGGGGTVHSEVGKSWNAVNLSGFGGKGVHGELQGIGTVLFYYMVRVEERWGELSPEFELAAMAVGEKAFDSMDNE